MTLSEVWGPYTGVADAKTALAKFVDGACGHDVGIVWVSQGAVHPLRAPQRDGQSIGVVAVFEWMNSPPPPPKAPSGWRATIRSWIHQALEAEYQSSMAEAQANMAMGQVITKGLDALMRHHADDAAGVIFDVIGVAAFILLLPTGVSELAVVGVVGGGILLASDTVAFALETSGDEVGAAKFKERTEYLRLAATIMTLPDLAYGGYKVLRELREIKDLAAVDRATATAAAGFSRQTANAQRADMYAQIVERANLKAQIRGQQIAALIRLEVKPRRAGLGGVGLFVRDEINNDDSLMHQVISRLRVSCIAVHH